MERRLDREKYPEYVYPEHKPDYETAFVFLNEELMRGKAPAWAQTLTLDIEMEWETGR